MKADIQFSEAYWRSELGELEALQFPQRPGLRYIPSPGSKLEGTVSVRPLGDTLSNVLRLAWVTTVSQYTGPQDILFGVVMSGRDVLVTGMKR